MEINLNDLIKLVFKKFWILVVCAVICVAGAFGITKVFIKPTYSTGVTFLVVYDGNATSSNNLYGQILVARNKIPDFEKILDQNMFFETVANKMKEISSESNATEKEIGSALTFKTDSENNSGIAISISTTSPKTSYLIAQAIIEEINSFVTSKEGLEKYVFEQVSAAPTEPKSPSSPNTMMICLVSFALSLVIGVLLILLINMLDVKVKGEDELIIKYKLPLLGTIPSHEE